MSVLLIFIVFVYDTLVILTKYMLLTAKKILFFFLCFVYFNSIDIKLLINLKQNNASFI